MVVAEELLRAHTDLDRYYEIERRYGIIFWTIEALEATIGVLECIERLEKELVRYQDLERVHGVSLPKDVEAIKKNIAALRSEL